MAVLQGKTDGVWGGKNISLLKREVRVGAQHILLWDFTCMTLERICGSGMKNVLWP